MSDLEKRVLTLEVDSASKRLYWQFLAVVFCTLLGVSSLVSGTIVGAILFLLMGALNVFSLPKTWTEFKTLREKLKSAE